MSEWESVTPVTGAKAPEIEIEIEEEPVQAAEEETPAAKTPKVKPEIEELEGIETAGAQRRIRQLVQKRKEEQGRADNYARENQELKAKLAAQEKDLSTSIKKNLDTSEEGLKGQIEAAKTAYERAVDEADSGKMVEASAVIAEATAKLVNLEPAKASWETYNQNVNQEAPVAAAAPQEEQVADPKAVAWTSKNDWFGEDNIKTAVAFAIDYELKEEGFDPAQDDFWDELDARMSVKYPTVEQNETASETDSTDEVEPANPTPTTSQSVQVVGGASRTPPAPRGGGGASRVKMTKTDLAYAEKWGIPIERYAEEKLKAELADGEYTPV